MKPYRHFNCIMSSRYVLLQVCILVNSILNYFTVESKTSDIVSFQVAISARQVGTPPRLPPPPVHSAAQVVEIYCGEINPQFYQDPYNVDMKEDITTSQV